MTAVRILDEPKQEQPLPRRHVADVRRDRFRKRYGLMLIGVFALAAYTMLLCCITGTIVHHNTLSVLEQEKVAAVEAYKRQQAEQLQQQYFQSGEASKEAFLNREIDAGARLMSAMKNDTQKGGILCNAIARMMNSAYPDTMQEVVAQEGQWMFYSPDNKITAHDREMADQILRDYYNGIVPNGLTKDYIYGAWSESDYVLRNTWEYGPGTLTWRYQ